MSQFIAENGLEVCPVPTIVKQLESKHSVICTKRDMPAWTRKTNLPHFNAAAFPDDSRLRYADLLEPRYRHR